MKKKPGKRAALATFLDTFGLDTLHDIGPTLSCQECEALANLLDAYGQTEEARALRESHALSDDEGDLPEHVALRRQIGDKL